MASLQIVHLTKLIDGAFFFHIQKGSVVYDYCISGWQTYLHGAEYLLKITSITTPLPVKSEVITMFRRSRYWPLSEARLVLSMPSHSVAKIHFNIILLVMLRSFKWYLSFKPSNQYILCISLFCIHAKCSTHLVPLNFIAIIQLTNACPSVTRMTASGLFSVHITEQAHPSCW